MSLSFPVAILVLLVFVFMRTAYHGTRTALGIAPLTPAHRRSANWTLALTGALVVSLELVLWLGSLPRIEHGTLFKIHLCFAVTYVALILMMRFVITGKDSRGVHVVLGILCTADFLGMVSTGIALLMRALLA